MWSHSDSKGSQTNWSPPGSVLSGQTAPWWWPHCQIRAGLQWAVFWPFYSSCPLRPWWLRSKSPCSPHHHWYILSIPPHSPGSVQAVFLTRAIHWIKTLCASHRSASFCQYRSAAGYLRFSVRRSYALTWSTWHSYIRLTHLPRCGICAPAGILPQNQAPSCVLRYRSDAEAVL